MHKQLCDSPGTGLLPRCVGQALGEIVRLAGYSFTVNILAALKKETPAIMYN